MPELRKDPLLGCWVVYAPERKQRPRDFAVGVPGEKPGKAFQWGGESLTPPEVLAFRPPGLPANGPGWRVRVVPNRFPALRVEGELTAAAAGLCDWMNGIGAHEVIIETPRPGLALEDQPVEGITEVLQAFQGRMLDLARDSRFRAIQVFKNVGVLAGATLRHPHSQLVALPIVPRGLQDRLDAARLHYQAKGRNLFADLVQTERNDGTRLVWENAGFTAFCPYASRFPFEVRIVPKRQNPHFPQCDDRELALAADMLKNVLQRLAAGLGTPDYNLLLHTAPLPGPADSPTLGLDFRWHLEVLPRLGGMGGFELATGSYINPTLPEEAAAFLRAVKIGRQEA